MILTSTTIKSAVDAGHIVISPFVPAHLGPNSYDVTLGRTMRVYDLAPNDGLRRVVVEDGKPVELPIALDPRQENRTLKLTIPDDGQILVPGRVYLAHTVERIGSKTFVPMLEGRSSLARLGVFVHVTAGFGDLGFEGQWTLEIVVLHPVMLYAGMRVAQVYFHTITEEPISYYSGKYVGPTADGPVASRSWLDKGLT